MTTYKCMYLSLLLRYRAVQARCQFPNTDLHKTPDSSGSSNYGIALWKQGGDDSAVCSWQMMQRGGQSTRSVYSSHRTSHRSIRVEFEFVEFVASVLLIGNGDHQATGTKVTGQRSGANRGKPPWYEEQYVCLSLVLSASLSRTGIV
jgi:hypothetical protein